jgi:hypothetical protein
VGREEEVNSYNNVYLMKVGVFPVVFLLIYAWVVPIAAVPSLSTTL